MLYDDVLFAQVMILGITIVFGVGCLLGYLIDRFWS